VIVVWPAAAWHCAACGDWPSFQWGGCEFNINPEAEMAVVALIPEGTRVRIRRGMLPLDADAIGRTGIVLDASEYQAHRYGVILDTERGMRYFAPAELEVIERAGLAGDKVPARRRALP
jgi:hypothetical protein